MCVNVRNSSQSAAVLVLRLQKFNCPTCLIIFETPPTPNPSQNVQSPNYKVNTLTISDSDTEIVDVMKEDNLKSIIIFTIRGHSSVT